MRSHGANIAGLGNGLSSPGGDLDVPTAKKIAEIYQQFNSMLHNFGHLMEHDASLMASVKQHMDDYDMHMGG
ncbi:hypothetical protein FC21_GL000420 [Limosilactobacillus equigenerosi DSM 18793 = JCM 14505]|uniref:Uncharacterized protein n=1 Tax=Limosilactobacillus equigenerosi DSM 18793 = JCM 14505 TaxID=1423742 RepID=A0A0R1UFJ7_9LACO|nr:hypothetical protein FC21_GL000420 [Limosilactobacillus equigenerosi DSM 18793 = JCM 14505]